MALGRRRTFLVALVGTCGVGIGGAVLVSADSPGTIQGCVNNFGTLRVTSDPSGFHLPGCQSLQVEHAVTFDGIGPAGPAGAAGPAGPTGPTGKAGANGRDAGGGATVGTTASGAPTNFIAGAAFAMSSRHFVRAEVDCPKGVLATGGSAAVVSPLGESPAFDGPSAGTSVVGATGHPAVGWLAEASNTSGQAASLRLTVVCAGPASGLPGVTKRLILSRPLRAVKAKKP